MNSEPVLSPEVTRLARAIRFALVCLVVALSYFPIRATASIADFKPIFADMLNGKPLPTLTVFVIRAHLALLAGAWLIPLASIGTLFSRRVVASFYILGVLCLSVVALFLLMYQALSEPLFVILRALEGS